MAWRGHARVMVLALALAACGGEGGGASGGGGSPAVEGPMLESIQPGSVDGETVFTLIARGSFFPGDLLTVGGKALPTKLVGAELHGDAGPYSRGDYQVRVLRGGVGSEPLALVVGNSVPKLKAPASQTLDEDQPLELYIEASDFDKDPLRVLLTGLPPGARWDEPTRTLRFTPDFVQGGGATWTVTVLASDGTVSTSASFDIAVNDSIAPPAPMVLGQSDHGDHYRLTLQQKTDGYLDSPGYGGRSFVARVVVPKDATAEQPYPVRVYLHGFGGAPYTGGSGEQFRVYPHDPDNTYWWGYSEKLPGGKPDEGTVPNYTQRRVLHLLEWVLENHPGADRRRVYVAGSSMGGAGAAALGLMYARHFCYVHATLSQTIPKNHRPARVAQLSGWWGTPALDLPDASGMGNWTRGDLTRALRDEPEARQQLLFTRHGKDDGTIHFGAVVMPSPLTELSFYQTLEAERVGHYNVWDEGAHGPADPVLGDGWWDGGWDPAFDGTSYLRSDLPFPAFSGAAHDGDPGDGSGNGQQPWSDNSGYAGKVGVAGDTGWSGDLAGAQNRHLRWDANGIVDELDRLEMPLRVFVGSGAPPPKPGYPSTGDLYQGPLPVAVDVTPRRVQRFHCLPGETIAWSFGALGGTVQANADGSVTVPALPIGEAWQTLVLTRTGSLLELP